MLRIIIYKKYYGSSICLLLQIVSSVTRLLHLLAVAAE
jgi:hypothetical protein